MYLQLTKEEEESRKELIAEFNEIFNKVDPSPCDTCDRLTRRARIMIDAQDKRIERLRSRIAELEASNE